MKTIILISIMIFAGCSAKRMTGNAGNNESDPGVPVCIQKLIRQFEEEEKQNPPRSVYSYTYKGKTVFYVPPVCCDRFSDLYDSNCNLMGHPDGGFTGRGDGKNADFGATRSAEKLIWKDERK